MARSIKEAHEFTLALLRAAGIPSEQVTRVVFVHDVTGRPTFKVTYVAWDADKAELNHSVIRFVPEVPE